MTITVRRATPADAAAYARIMGDPMVYPGLMQLPHPSEELWRTRLTGSTAAGSADVLLVAEAEGEVVGSCGMHPTSQSQRRRHAMMIGISVAGAWQGRGVGSVLMAAMCDYADHWLALLRLELTVFADNAGAIALYRKFGFVVEGTHRGYALRHGRYEDVLAMARLHPQPPGIVPFEVTS